ncbi:MAG: hypothetical protein H7Y00_01640 [Fimbriimonadaceae bacterium]|nr:hypothetical protein [Chitinophagales bacterium]
METYSTTQFYAEIARKLSESKTLQETFEIIDDACIACFSSDSCIIFTYDAESDVFIRKSIRTKDLYFKTQDVPVVLKLSQLFEPYSHKRFLLNSTKPSPFFENDSFLSGNELIIPVRMDNVLTALIVCTKEDKFIISPEHEHLCVYLESVFNTALRNFAYYDAVENLKKEIHKRDAINSNRLQIINDRLRKSNQELKQFAYTASHDLQEPLRMITNYIN